MIISPPFLPNARSGASDDVSGDSASAGIVADSEWIESLMVGGKPISESDILNVTLSINGGKIGLQDRINHTLRIFTILNDIPNKQ
ncbi:hypothetical protein [Cupriavidus oxalaticus]|uniref:hypothetical protein n=1 Tax=Cupriavidus oxalaticus TaxID=96344 RepID=UPI001243BF38|nr:hypothetical protein [Cupriavidus oxalaticus]